MFRKLIGEKEKSQIKQGRISRFNEFEQETKREEKLQENNTLVEVLPSERIVIDSDIVEEQQNLAVKQEIEDNAASFSQSDTDETIRLADNTVEKLPLFQRYHIELETFGDSLITTLPLPQRVSNALMRNGYQTIQEFLKLSETDIADMKQVGQKAVNDVVALAQSLAKGKIVPCEEQAKTGGPSKTLDINPEIRYCDRYNISSENYDQIAIDAVNMPNRLRSRLAVRGCETVGQFLRLTPKEISEIPGAGKGTVQAAEAVINELYAVNGAECFYTNNAEPIDLEKLIVNIPYERKNKYVEGYIQAYTDDKEVRERLFQLCHDNEMKVGDYCQTVLNDDLNKEQIELYNSFFAWISFDLQDEIAQIRHKLLSNERTMEIVTMRAHKKTLQDIGTELDITRERVRQIEKKASKQFLNSINTYKIIKKIYAERNQDKVLTSAELSEYFGDMTDVFLYFLRGAESADYEYDEYMDVFVVEDQDLIERMQKYLETLPETFKEKEYENVVKAGIENYGLNEEIIHTAIKERYKCTGSVYHRNRLTLTDIYKQVLDKYYPEGMHVYDTREMHVFRQRVADEYGEVKLPREDRAIVAAIARVGILCGRGIYKTQKESYISKELETEIKQYIDKSDANIFLMNTLFTEFQDKLEDCGISNKYYLQGVLKTLFHNQYYFRRDYLAKDDSVTSLYNDIVQFIKTNDYPVFKEEIYRRYPGITDIVVNLAVSDQEIINYFGQYLHASKLKVSIVEKEKIQRTLMTMTEELGYVHGKDLFDVLQTEVGEFLTRNGIKFGYSLLSVLGYLYRDEYVIERPYIARNGANIDRPEEILSELIRDNEILEISEINSLAQELHYPIYSILEFINQYNDTHLLVNKTQIATIDYIGIDKNTIDLLYKLISDEVMGTRAIASLEGILRLPQINVPWNEWLIYSIVNKYYSDFEVGMSAVHFRSSFAIIAPAGKMDVNSVDAIYTGASDGNLVMADDLTNIDELIMDAIEDEINF